MANLFVTLVMIGFRVELLIEIDDIVYTSVLYEVINKYSIPNLKQRKKKFFIEWKTLFIFTIIGKDSVDYSRHQFDTNSGNLEKRKWNKEIHK